MSITQFTGILLIALPVGFNAAFFLLQRAFEYPDILRKPTGYILTRFREGGRPLVVKWYIFTLTALLFVPVGVLTPMVFTRADVTYVAVAGSVGVLAGLVQTLGLIR